MKRIRLDLSSLLSGLDAHHYLSLDPSRFRRVQDVIDHVTRLHRGLRQLSSELAVFIDEPFHVPREQSVDVFDHDDIVKIRLVDSARTKMAAALLLRATKRRAEDESGSSNSKAAKTDYDDSSDEESTDEELKEKDNKLVFLSGSSNDDDESDDSEKGSSDSSTDSSEDEETFVLTEKSVKKLKKEKKEKNNDDESEEEREDRLGKTSNRKVLTYSESDEDDSSEENESNANDKRSREPFEILADKEEDSSEENESSSEEQISKKVFFASNKVDSKSSDSSEDTDENAKGKVVKTPFRPREEKVNNNKDDNSSNDSESSSKDDEATNTEKPFKRTGASKSKDEVQVLSSPEEEEDQEKEEKSGDDEKEREKNGSYKPKSQKGRAMIDGFEKIEKEEKSGKKKRRRKRKPKNNNKLAPGQSGKTSQYKSKESSTPTKTTNDSLSKKLASSAPKVTCEQVILSSKSSLNTSVPSNSTSRPSLVDFEKLLSLSSSSTPLCVQRPPKQDQNEANNDRPDENEGEKFENLVSMPSVNDIIMFQQWKLNDDGTPGLSPSIRAKVVGTEGKMMKLSMEDEEKEVHFADVANVMRLV